jgi:DNA-binding CsgD family transcriptional regulator
MASEGEGKGEEQGLQGPPGQGKDPRVANRSPRRRAVQIAAENLQIIQLTIQGLSDSEIMKKLGLTEANYRYRIRMIQAEDMERILKEQTPEANAFIYQRTLEKLSNLELNANAILKDPSTSTKDKLATMYELREIYVQETSLFLYGPSMFLGDEYQRIMGMKKDLR